MSNMPQMENDSKVTGVFPPQKVKIADARSVSNEDVFKNGKPVDVGIEFKLDIGKDFYPLYTITGNYKLVDGTWKPSTTTRIKIALQRLGVKWTKFGENNEVTRDILDQCIGKEIYIIKYCNKLREDGKPNYVTFSEFFLATTSDAKEKLLQKFNDSVAQGYTKIFDPETAPTPVVAEEPAQPFNNQF